MSGAADRRRAVAAPGCQHHHRQLPDAGRAGALSPRLPGRGRAAHGRQHGARGGGGGCHGCRFRPRRRRLPARRAARGRVAARRAGGDRAARPPVHPPASHARATGGRALAAARTRQRHARGGRALAAEASGRAAAEHGTGRLRGHPARRGRGPGAQLPVAQRGGRCAGRRHAGAARHRVAAPHAHAAPGAPPPAAGHARHARVSCSWPAVWACPVAANTRSPRIWSLTPP